MNAKKIFWIVALMACIANAKASWITNSFINSQSGTASIRVTGTPNSTPQVLTNGQTVYSLPWSITATNGIMSPTWVVVGQYTVQFGPQNDIFVIQCPQDSNTYSLWQLATNVTALTNWPSLPGVSSIQSGSNILATGQGPSWTINGTPTNLALSDLQTNNFNSGNQYALSNNAAGSLVPVVVVSGGGGGGNSNYFAAGLGINNTVTSGGGNTTNTLSVTAPTLTNNESLAVTLQNNLQVTGSIYSGGTIQDSLPGLNFWDRANGTNRSGVYGNANFLYLWSLSYGNLMSFNEANGLAFFNGGVVAAGGFGGNGYGVTNIQGTNVVGIPFVNIVDYGGVGDNVTPCYPAWTNAYNAVADGGTIYFPSGYWQFSNNVINLAAKNVHILGDGAAWPGSFLEGTILAHTNASGNFIIVSNNATELENLVIYNYAASTAGSEILELTTNVNHRGTSLDNVMIVNGWLQIDRQSSGLLWHENNVIRYQFYFGGEHIKNHLVPDGGDWTMQGDIDETSRAASYGLFLESGDGGKIASWKFNGGAAATNGLVVSPETATNLSLLTVSGSHIENMVGAGVVLGGGGGGSWLGTHFEDITFAMYASTNYPIIDTNGAANAATFDDITVLSLQSPSVLYLATTTNVTLGWAILSPSGGTRWTGSGNVGLSDPVNGGVLTNLTAANLTGTVPTANLGSGTANAGTALYGDQTYKVTTNSTPGTGIGITAGAVSVLSHLTEWLNLPTNTVPTTNAGANFIGNYTTTSGLLTNNPVGPTNVFTLTTNTMKNGTAYAISNNNAGATVAVALPAVPGTFGTVTTFNADAAGVIASMATATTTPTPTFSLEIEKLNTNNAVDQTNLQATSLINISGTSTNAFTATAATNIYYLRGTNQAVSITNIPANTILTFIVGTYTGSAYLTNLNSVFGFPGLGTFTNYVSLGALGTSSNMITITVSPALTNFNSWP